MGRPVMGVALRERLGDEASAALTDYIERHGDVWKNDVVTSLVTREYLDQQLGTTKDYLDQRLGAAKEHLDQQLGATREHLDQELGATREHLDQQLRLTREHFDQELRSTRTYLDQQLHSTREHFDQRLEQRLRPLVSQDLLEARLQTLVTKEEFFRGMSDLRKEMSNQRVELLRWSFLFWIGQVAATAGLISLSLHFAR